MTHRFRNRDLIRTLVLVTATVIVAGGCAPPFEWAGSTPESWNNAPDQEAGVRVLTVFGPSFTLAWDSASASVTGYRVYSRPHGASSWTLLAQDVGEPQFTIFADDLTDGLWEFAVSSLSVDGEESDLHHSRDPSAEPKPWILRWRAL